LSVVREIGTLSVSVGSGHAPGNVFRCQKTLCDLIQSYLYCKGVVEVGQRTTSAKDGRNSPAGIPQLSIFQTNFGWFGLLGRESRLVAVLAGHISAAEVRRAAAAAASAAVSSPEYSEADWDPQLRRRVEQYCLGDRIDFDDIPLELPRGTDFQSRVIKAVRRLRYGNTISYGRLAEKAGYPRAARAVGSVMKSNRFPIVVPCHRVVAAGDKPGGYTSPQGLGLKLRLLAMEAE
jgi:methylated-DNA-[protein]-cysteine S-methyltransferase